MAREPAPPEPAGDIPPWFLTYSDVITLMMTFFILLLTFASSEPEKFERMQVSLYGGSGANGLVSEADGPLEKDSLVVRQRPKSSRMTTRGSTMPPVHTEDARESVAKGLETLDKLEHDPTVGRSIEISLYALVDQDKRITALGTTMMDMFAKQIRKAPIFITFQVAGQEQFALAVALCHHLAETALVPYGRMAVGIRTDEPANKDEVKIVVKRDWTTTKNESTPK
jgi:flagellar motor protein MotB